MSDNIIPVGNTPIFEQLVREMAARGKKFESLLSPKGTANLEPVKSFGVSASEALRKASEGARQAREQMFPSAWIAKEVPQITPPTEKNAKLSVNFHPSEVVDGNNSIYGFVQARLNEFNKKHPNATDVVMTTHEELDGTVTLLIEGNELKGGVQFAKKPDWTENDTGLDLVEPKDGETTITQGQSAFHGAELKTEKMDQEMGDRRLHLYQAATISSGTIAVPRPLWISDEEADPHEE